MICNPHVTFKNKASFIYFSYYKSLIKLLRESQKIKNHLRTTPQENLHNSSNQIEADSY